MMVFGIVYAAQVGMALIPFKQAALTVMGPMKPCPAPISIMQNTCSWH